MEYERVREEVAIRLHTLARATSKVVCEDSPINEPWENLEKIWQDHYKKLAAQILSLKVGSRTLGEWIELYEKGKLRIEAENQELPQNPFNYEDECREYTAYAKAQQDMAGFVRCLAKEGT
jgi:hypothetical protein